MSSFVKRIAKSMKKKPTNDEKLTYNESGIDSDIYESPEDMYLMLGTPHDWKKAKNNNNSLIVKECSDSNLNEDLYAASTTYYEWRRTNAPQLPERPDYIHRDDSITYGPHKAVETNINWLTERTTDNSLDETYDEIFNKLQISSSPSTSEPYYGETSGGTNEGSSIQYINVSPKPPLKATQNSPGAQLGEGLLCGCALHAERRLSEIQFSVGYVHQATSQRDQVRLRTIIDDLVYMEKDDEASGGETAAAPPTHHRLNQPRTEPVRLLVPHDVVISAGTQLVFQLEIDERYGHDSGWYVMGSKEKALSVKHILQCSSSQPTSSRRARFIAQGPEFTVRTVAKPKDLSIGIYVLLEQKCEENDSYQRYEEINFSKKEGYKMVPIGEIPLIIPINNDGGENILYNRAYDEHRSVSMQSLNLPPPDVNNVHKATVYSCPTTESSDSSGSHVYRGVENVPLSEATFPVYDFDHIVQADFQSS